MVGDDFVMQLHAWDAHVGDASQPVGNGLLLWFQVDAAAARAKELGAKFVEALHFNEAASHHEFWVS